MMETPRAEMTLVGTVAAQVHSSDVLMQVGFLSEAARAVGTLVPLGPRVRVHVPLKNLALREGLVALFALERLHSCVDDHVTLKGAGTR